MILVFLQEIVYFVFPSSIFLSCDLTGIHGIRMILYFVIYLIDYIRLKFKLLDTVFHASRKHQGEVDVALLVFIIGFNLE